jgi:uncharacterized protein (DUF2147 family)
MQKSWLAALALTGLSGPALANDAVGTWLVEEKSAVIKVEACEPGLCGLIGWAQTPGADRNNPDPAKRSRNIVGMQIFSMKPAGQNRWEGEIYNAKDGKTYSGRVALTGPNSLRIEGCVLGFLCGGETWIRAKCDEPSANPAAQTKRPPADKSAPKGAAAASAAFVPLTGCRAVAP